MHGTPFEQPIEHASPLKKTHPQLKFTAVTNRKRQLQ